MVLLAFGALMFFGGCAVNNCKELPRSEHSKNTIYSNTEKKNYKIGSAHSSYVGTQILDSQKLHLRKKMSSIKTRNAFEILQDIKTTNGATAIKSGEWATASCFDHTTGEYFVNIVTDCFFDTNIRCSYAFMVNQNGEVTKKIDDDNKLTTISLPTNKIFRLIPNGTEKDITEEEIEVIKDSYRHELIYNGKSGNDIKVSYREYKDDMARPAFYQDLTYNLKESDIIRYKNYKIKVHKATNEEISYTVLED